MYLLGREIKKEIMMLTMQTHCEAIPFDVTNIESVRDAIIYCKA